MNSSQKLVSGGVMGALTVEPSADVLSRVAQAGNVHACGHRTTHTQRIGCCAGCRLLFSSDAAFEKHRRGGECLDPEAAGLTGKPSRTAPEETVWSLAGSEFTRQRSNA